MAKRKYWLFKSEPDVYSLGDLERDASTYWEGVRNYQARNFLRDEVKEGDLVLYYHSRTRPPGIVGVARVSKEAYPDPTQFDRRSPYFDPKATPDDPRWVVVDVEFVARFDDAVTLDQLKADRRLGGMLVTRKGQRLSIQPVEAKHWRRVCQLAGFDPSSAA